MNPPLCGYRSEPLHHPCTESESTLSGVSGGATVKIHIIPVNAAGDGPESDIAQIVVP